MKATNETPEMTEKPCKARSGTMLAKYSRFVFRYRCCITAFWMLLVTPIGLYCSPRLLRNTVSANEGFKKRKGTKDSPKELQLKEDHLQVLSFRLLLEQRESGPDIGTITDGKSSLYNATRDYALGVDSAILNYWSRHHKEDPPLESIEVRGYYTFREAGLKKLAKKLFWAEEGRTTYLSFDIKAPDTIRREFLLEAAIKGAEKNRPEGVDISTTGPDLMERDVQNGLEDDFALIHNVSAPLAIAVLLLSLGSLKVLIIPVLVVVATLCGTSAIMLPLSKVLTVSQFLPLLMTTMAIALSVDYCLFSLSRFKEDIEKGMDTERAVRSMLQHSGHTVVVSGFILSGSCLGALVLPLPFLASFGFCFPVLVIVSVLVNLSLVPAMLHITYGTGQQSCGCVMDITATSCITVFRNAESGSKKKRTSGVNALNTFQAASRSKEGDESGAELRKSVWFKTGKILANPYTGAIVLVVMAALLLPVCYYVFWTKMSFAANLQFRRGSQSLNTFNRIGEKFGYGLLYKNEIWFHSETASTYVTDETSYEAINKALHQLTGDEFPATPTIGDFAGISTIAGKDVPYKRYQQALQCGDGCIESLRTIKALSEQMFSVPGNHSTMTLAMVETDPTSSDGIRWMGSVTKKLQALKAGGQLPDLTFDFHGVPTVYEVIKSVWDAFPIMIGIALAAVYVLMGLSFQSALLPLLSVLSIILTQAFVYGACVLVYQHGALNSLGIGGLMSTEEIHWLVPIVTFTLMLGLGLDYDTFLIGRIMEYRLRGYTHQSSVVLAIFRTRKVITSAALIMAATLGGLLFSSAVVMNQMAFVLVLSVLMDAFVVRTTILPIILSFAGDATWWPMKVPPATMDALHTEEGYLTAPTVDEDDEESLDDDDADEWKTVLIV